MPNGDDSTIHLIHTLWSTALTALVAAFGWLVQWNWTRISKDVETKADKADLQQLRADLTERWARQDRLQEGMNERLDRILERLPPK